MHMSKNFVNALRSTSVANSNFTRTENNAVARATTGSDLLNFFSIGGALRTRQEVEIHKLFDAAFTEDPQYALKAAFYFRDIRGGQGERRTFRSILKYLADNPETRFWLRSHLHLIPEYGRWDDLFVLFDTVLEKDVLELIKRQLKADAKAENPSILVKWLPSENASSAETKRQAYKIIKYLGTTPRVYRKSLAHRRALINVLEQKLSANRWEDVNYSHVPSQANVLYRNAFKRHDADRYTKFIEDARTGKAEIKAGVLYPYDIVRKCFSREVNYYYSRDAKVAVEDSATLDALWKNLPDYYNGVEDNALVVADVSGSMFMSNDGLPAAISISLAIYAAERNSGPFKGKFISFSANPTFHTVTGKDIKTKVENLAKTEWQQNTDIEAVFKLVLNTALKHKLSQKDLPKKIYIISDMEFDAASSSRRNETLFNKIRNDYKNAGYEMPLLVFWNVDSRNDQFPMSMDDRGFLNVSGASASIFKNLLKSEYKTAYDFMIEVLDAPRYKAVSFIGEK